ncbi:glycerol-3-phosphate responsive antiterminator [Gracilibacillus alcaliphilus]|uniref:glycerol-3-phosphate responsive antiterminator n=1 Tax=Gracilibacillus alcaliphilus TaxID=1401441 RepID=UPI001958AC15|nr:glycerol-3-phosphate responsive antiterminator [Gracilibacillus alcaliphilus]MBM7679014.1 glycerol uptake operon antiterminator [Gracilibacillus alcaliphilus]
MHQITDMVQSQVIASIKKPEDIDKAIHSQANITFLLIGDLMSTGDYIKRLKQAGKKIFLHMDFIDGLANSHSALRFIAEKWKPDGIITTKSGLIKSAREEGLMTIQRIFLIDHSGLDKGIEIAHKCNPDAIEVLPGIMPVIIDKLTQKTHLPIISGGLISTKQDILQGLRAGALAISTGNPKLWNLDL